MNCQECKKCKYVSKNDAKSKRKEMMGLLANVSAEMKSDGFGGFSPSVVGSAKKKMAIQHGESPYDTDIQIVFQSKKSKTFQPDIKMEIYNRIKNKLNNNQSIKLSTSVIEINEKRGNKNPWHSFDIAIIRNNEKQDICRGKDNSDNHFSWEEVQNLNQAYVNFREISDNETLSEIKQRYINRKCINRGYTEDIDDEYRSSSQLFVEVVNEIIK